MLPDLIEIVPLTGPVSARVSVPGSKSITNRALVLAALGLGPITLRGALWSEDTQIMVAALRELGWETRMEPDPDEICNRTITIAGTGGEIPRAGTPDKPLEIFVGNAGTVARFLAALVCLGHGSYRLQGTKRMEERPQAALFQALRQLGYTVDSPNDKLPAVIHGTGPRPGQCEVSIGESSQFASALILAGGVGGWDVRVVGENSEESPYVSMTLQLAGQMRAGGAPFDIAPDASSASYIWAANWLLNHAPGPGLSTAGSRVEPTGGGSPTPCWQVDSKFPSVLDTAPVRLSRERDLGDSIMTAITLAPFFGGEFTELGRLRLQECDRVMALRTELTRCGASVREDHASLSVSKSTLHGAEIETYDDHRMAMCFAILGLKVPGIRIKNPACVKKTFPNFFQKLAATPPAGLGATILAAGSIRRLEPADLFAQ